MAAWRRWRFLIITPSHSQFPGPKHPWVLNSEITTAVIRRDNQFDIGACQDLDKVAGPALQGVGGQVPLFIARIAAVSAAP